MLVIAVALVLVSLACAVVLSEASKTVIPLVGRPVPLAVAGSETDWRGAALNAHTDTTNLQFAIVAALETEDLGHRDTILRSALRETGSRAPVRVTL
ncbi:MAG: hypothetical protein ACJ72D_12620 [Marmoricola sp.]